VLVPAGGNCKTVHVRIKLLALDTSHFTGAGWNTGLRYRSFGRKATLEEIIVENSPYNFTHGSRKRLLAEGTNSNNCETRDLDVWRGQPIPLELHHANGVNDGYYLANLQLLCANCRSLTDDYRGKNQKNKI